MNNWLRPSMQQPRWIAQAVKSAFAPILQVGKFVKDYWETFDEVLNPKGKKDDKK